MIGYLDEVRRAFVLIFPKMIGYVKTFKDKGRFKNKNNKLICLHIDDNKLLKKHKAISTNIKDLKNIELNALPVHDDRYIKIKMRTYGDKVYTNFRRLDVTEDRAECKSITVISVDSLLLYASIFR